MNLNPSLKISKEHIIVNVYVLHTYVARKKDVQLCNFPP